MFFIYGYDISEIELPSGTIPTSKDDDDTLSDGVL